MPGARRGLSGSVLAWKIFILLYLENIHDLNTHTHTPTCCTAFGDYRKNNGSVLYNIIRVRKHNNICVSGAGIGTFQKQPKNTRAPAAATKFDHGVYATDDRGLPDVGKI